MKKIWLLISLFAVLCVATSNAAYIDEYPEAYTWAYNNWITTMTSIDKANMNWEITRIALAKMISNYAINVLNRPLRTSWGCKFDDISNELDEQYDNWVSNACAMRLMWQNISKFRPYDKVTVAEFWTILSRLLHDIEFNSYGNEPFYKYHIEALKYAWIMPDISNPTWRNAIRGDIMSMLRKSSVWGNLNDIIKVYKAEGYKLVYVWDSKARQNIEWDKVLYIDKKYWFAIELWEGMDWWYIEFPSDFTHQDVYDDFYTDEQIEERKANEKPFDWEKIFDFYENDIYEKKKQWACSMYVYKVSKNTSFYEDRNNKYSLSFFCPDGIDIGLLYRHINMFELR